MTKPSHFYSEDPRGDFSLIVAWATVTIAKKESIFKEVGPYVQNSKGRNSGDI